MSRILAIFTLVILSLGLHSCCLCCTSDTKPPKLKKLPAFNELPDSDVDSDSAK